MPILKTLTRTTIVAGGTAWLALAMGCSGGEAIVVLKPAGPASPPPIVASIGPSYAGPVAPFVGFGNASPVIDLTISASKTVDLHQVTIRMPDGSNLGGPMVTVPSPQLTEQFGTCRIFGGTTRAFTFRPAFSLSLGSRTVAADITVIDASRVTHGITVQRPWP